MTLRWIHFLLILALSGMTTLSARTRPNYSALIHRAETQATPPARRVLSTARTMVEHGTIIRGSCWDYLNVAFSRAGFPAGKRTILYRNGKSGPYADIRKIRPGDWLYYINHSYGNIEHSGLFIGWINRTRRKGLILSYGGERRNKPGRYRPYDLSHVYQIIRPQ